MYHWPRQMCKLDIYLVTFMKFGLWFGWSWHIKTNFIYKQLNSTCLWALSQAASPPETLPPQWWQPRWGEAGLAPTTFQAFPQGSSEVHLSTSLQCARVFPLEFLWAPQSPSICQTPCGRGHLSDLSVSASYQALYLISEGRYFET